MSFWTARDFFGWYLTTWNEQIESTVRVVLQRLATVPVPLAE